MKLQLWLGIKTCLAYCTDRELYHAIDSLKEQVRVLIDLPGFTLIENLAYDKEHRDDQHGYWIDCKIGNSDRSIYWQSTETQS